MYKRSWNFAFEICLERQKFLGDISKYMETTFFKTKCNIFTLRNTCMQIPFSLFCHLSTFVLSESKKLQNLWRASGQQLKRLLKILWWTYPSKKRSLLICPSIPMVNYKGTRSFLTYNSNCFSGKRQSLCRTAETELRLGTVPSVSVTHKTLPGCNDSLSFDKEAKMPFHSVHWLTKYCG